MRNIIIKLLFFCCITLVSCNKKDNNLIDNFLNYNHLDLLGLKGNVSELNIRIHENEINDNYMYIPKSKGINPVTSLIYQNVNFLWSNGAGEEGMNIYASLWINDFFIPFVLSQEIIKRNLLEIGCSDYKIKFNRNGFITYCSAIQPDGSVYKEIKITYDEYDRVIEYALSLRNNNEKMAHSVFKYSYNEYNLIDKKLVQHPKKDTFDTIYYQYHMDGNNINIYSEKDTVLLDIDDNKNLRAIIGNKSTIKFNGPHIEKITTYQYDSKKSDIDVNKDFSYKGNSVIEYIKTKRYSDESVSISKYNYNLNEYGFIKSIKSNFYDVNNLSFDYQYDINHNWSSLKIQPSIDRYKKVVKKLHELNDYYERYKGYDIVEANNWFLNEGYGLFFSAELEKEQIKKESAQIQVERSIFYYKD